MANFIFSAIAILAYGSQSIFGSSVIPIFLISFSLLGSGFKKQKSSFFLSLCVLCILLLKLSPALRDLWPLPSVMVSIVSAATLFVSREKNWFGKFKFHWKSFLASVGLGISALVVVYGWVLVTKPEIGQISFQIDRSLPIQYVGLLIFGFAVMNSFAEEFIFRGLALESMCGSSELLANIAQAVAFGFLHFKGFPFGFSGSFLALLFAFAMGALKIRSKSFIYPWISHFIANIGMGALVYQMTLAAH